MKSEGMKKVLILEADILGRCNRGMERTVKIAKGNFEGLDLLRSEPLQHKLHAIVGNDVIQW